MGQKACMQATENENLKCKNSCLRMTGITAQDMLSMSPCPAQLPLNYCPRFVVVIRCWLANLAIMNNDNRKADKPDPTPQFELVDEPSSK